MFKNNDKVLQSYKLAIKIILWIFAISFVAMGIALAIVVSVVFILITPFGLLGCYALWLKVKLYLSYLYDIKLIRNKLYEESNEDLIKDIFW